MLALYRMLRNLPSREHLLCTRYRRGCRHFLVYMVVDVLVTSFVVFGAISLASAHAVSHRDTHALVASEAAMLVHSGAVALDAQDLSAHVDLPIHHGSRYWLGPKNGYSYTTNCVTAGKLIVTYLKLGEAASDTSIRNLSVTAYENQALFSASLRPLSAVALHSAVNSRGDILSFDTQNMMTLSVILDATQEVVVIAYPSVQSLGSMIHDSEDLRVVSAFNKLG